MISAAQRELYLLYFLGCLSGLSYGIILPSLEFYVFAIEKEENLYALVSSGYTIGFLFGAIAFGMRNKETKTGTVLQETLFTYVIGNILYIIPSFNQSNHYQWITLFVGRVLVGSFAGGYSAVSRVYIGLIVPKPEITSVFSYWMFWATISLAIGPLLGVGLSSNKMGDSFQYSLPGLVLIASGLFGVIGMMCYWKNSGLQEILTSPPQININEGNPPSDSFDEYPVKQNWALFVFLACAFGSISIGFTMIETLVTPIASDQWGMFIGQTGYVHCIIGIAVCISALSVQWMSKTKQMTDRTIYMLSLVVAMASYLICCDFQSMGEDACQTWTDLQPNANLTLNEWNCKQNQDCIWNQDGTYGSCSACLAICHNPKKTLNLYQFAISCIGFAFSYSVGRVALNSLYSKLIAHYQMDKATMMTFLTATETLIRAGSSFLSVDLYMAANHHTYILMFCLEGLCLFLLLFTAKFYSRMILDV